jgi:hypothetical protein
VFVGGCGRKMRAQHTGNNLNHKIG